MLLERGALLNNRYRIIEILGQGGMGSVYKAVDENLGVEVAVKDNLFTTEEYARQFRREAVLLATLRHTNLPRVTDHFVVDSQGQYLVMDYIDGEDLRQRMDRIGVISEDEAIIIGAAICDALSYLASCNPPIVHRDIKPGNVRITPEGHIYLVDFGLAKDLRSHQTTTTGARAMTPGYSPPEQYGTARTDHRSDIYSLGATLYASLTGMIPEDALSRAVDHVDLTPIRKYNSRVSRRLAAVIERALDIRPDWRYQDAEEFKQALLNAGSPSQRNLDEFIVTPPPTLDDKPLPGDHALIPPDIALNLPRTSGQAQPISPDSSPVLAGRPQYVPPTPRNNRRRYWLLPLLILILTIFAISFYTINPSVSRSALARVFGNSGLMLPFLTASPTPTSTQTETAPETGILLEGQTSTALSTLPSLATETLPPSQTPTPNPSPTVTATPTLSPSPTATATQTPTPTITPTLVPTLMGGGGGQIAFAAVRNSLLPQIWIMSADGKDPRQLTDEVGGACQPAFSPDGNQLVFITPCDRNKESYPTAGLKVIPDVDAENIEVIPLPYSPGGDYDPAWSPDGTKIAFTSLRETGSPRIYVMDMLDKSISVLTPLFIRSYQPAWSPDGKQLVYVEEKTFGRIKILNPDGSSELLLEEPLEASDVHPAWSPNGEYIQFTRYPLQGKPPFLIGVSLNNNGQSQDPLQVAIRSVPMREAQFSPDGLWLVFESWTGPNHEISIMTTNGSSRKELSNDPSYDFDPTWRPGLTQ